MIASTASILAAPDLQAQANQTPQRHDRPTVAVADPHRPAALRTGRPERNQDLLVRRLHTAPTPGHLQPPCSTPPETLNRQPVLPFLFFQPDRQARCPKCAAPEQLSCSGGASRTGPSRSPPSARASSAARSTFSRDVLKGGRCPRLRRSQDCDRLRRVLSWAPSRKAINRPSRLTSPALELSGAVRLAAPMAHSAARPVASMASQAH